MMKDEYDLEGKGKQASREISAKLGGKLEAYLRPFLSDLNKQIDKRLVRTLLKLVIVILQFRHSHHGLLLSELGSYISSPEQGPAGTKRISNLLRSRKWHYGLIERFLWGQGDESVAELAQEGKDALCLWDESVIEKAESIALEGLCAVRSSVARRLKRIKPGYFNPPGGQPVFVPGMNWVAVMVTGLKSRPTLAAMRWWTTRGRLQKKKRDVEAHLLQVCMRRWGKQVIHVWDRGFVGKPWLSLALGYQARFVMRWRQDYHLVGTKGVMKAWQITRAKRSCDHRLIWDARRQCHRKTGIYFCQVAHPAWPDTPSGWLSHDRVTAAPRGIY